MIRASIITLVASCLCGPMGSSAMAVESRQQGHLSPPSLITPGKIYEYAVELLPTAIVFRRGHRIRVHLTSSCFPLWDRNPNTGNAVGMDDKLQVARQTIYHDREHPSYIVLPVVSKSD